MLNTFTYFSGKGLYQTKLERMLKGKNTHLKNVTLVFTSELYCLINLILNQDSLFYSFAGSDANAKIKILIDKYSAYLPEYEYQLNKLWKNPTANLAEWFFDYVIDDCWRKQYQ